MNFRSLLDGTTYTALRPKRCIENSVVMLLWRMPLGKVVYLYDGSNRVDRLVGSQMERELEVI